MARSHGSLSRVVSARIGDAFLVDTANTTDAVRPLIRLTAMVVALSGWPVAERMSAARNASVPGDAATGSCGCNAAAVDYPDQNLIKECNGTNDMGLNPPKPLSLCSWSVADVVCPAGGCYGFSFKMPTGFTTGVKEGLPPAANCFPGPPSSPWDLPFNPASLALAGSCSYSQAPPSDFCPTP